ncbi:hypothetical protein PMAYCL1PPCAC_20533, partial [Pristionchus mayeri]
LHLDGGRDIEGVEGVEDRLLYFLEVCIVVLVGDVLRMQMQSKVRAVVLEVVVVRQFIRNLLVDGKRRLVGPTARDVARSVPATTDHHQGHIVGAEELDARSVA